MDVKERYVARILFANKVYRSDGQAYEDLFVAVMTKANPNFRPVKPQGRIGDRKNDGFDQTTGTYYQVYAPEDARQREKEAIEKLVEDFAGLKTHWESICQIREYHFVLNDKFRGAYPTLEAELSKIKGDHSLKKANPFLCKDLENQLFSLSDDAIFAVIGHLPTPDLIDNLQFAALNDVIDHLFKNIVSISRTENLRAPDFEEKIKFNKLGSRTAALLSIASFQNGTLENYFELNSDFAKDNIKTVFASLYEQALPKFLHIEENTRNDYVFFEILDNACPVSNVAYQNAVLILMAHFFEACDIFEEPREA